MASGPPAVPGAIRALSKYKLVRCSRLGKGRGRGGEGGSRNAKEDLGFFPDVVARAFAFIPIVSYPFDTSA